MEKSKSPNAKVKAETLKAIKGPAEGYLQKIESLLQDHYLSINTLNDQDSITLMELKISAQILVSFLRDLVDQAEEANVDHLYLQNRELTTIANLAKGLSSAVLIPIGNTNLREH